MLTAVAVVGLPPGRSSPWFGSGEWGLSYRGARLAMVLVGRFVYGGWMGLSSELAEALGAGGDLDEGVAPIDEGVLPRMAQDVIDHLASKWKKLWKRARNEGLESLRIRDKVLLLKVLDDAAGEAGYTTPSLRAAAVDQVLAFTY